MDQNALVSDWVAAGQELLSRLRDSGWTFTAAFWANVVNDEKWRLYLATSDNNVRGSQPLYEAVLAVTDDDPEGNNKWGPLPGIHLDDVTAIDSTDPMARDVAYMAERFPNQVGRWHRDHLIGGKAVNGLYIYPLPVPAA